MGAMVWWLIPLAATVIAVAWVSWLNRARPPADTHDSLEEHERFKQAMAKQTRKSHEQHPESQPHGDADEGRDVAPGDDASVG
ncbi:MAG: hypothetical protein WAN48_13875 [Actinomycetes bacterium]